MSIATAITNLQGKIANAYTAIQEKGGTLPQVQNAANLSATIADIPSGGAGSKWGMTPDEVLYSINETLRPFGNVSGDVNFSGISAIADYRLYGAFENSNIKSLSFPNLITIGNPHTIEYICKNCKELTSVSFPGLSSGNLAYSFTECTKLSSVSFPNLKESGGMSDAFRYCSSLSSISFPNLTNISGTCQYLCYNCSQLTSVYFPKLSSLETKSPTTNAATYFSQAFDGTKVSSLSFPELTGIVANSSTSSAGCFSTGVVSAYYFPKLTVLKKTSWTSTNNAQYVFSNSCKELHFGAENQAVIEASDYFSTRWGAGAECQVFFDL